MKKYEYKTGWSDANSLTDYNQDGWEFSHPHPTSSAHVILRRELLDEKPDKPETVRLKIVMEKCEYAVGGFIPRLYVGDKMVSNVDIDPMTLRRDFTYKDIKTFGGYVTDRELVKDTYQFNCKLDSAQPWATNF